MYRHIADINVLEDEAFRRRIVWESVAVLVGGALIGLVILVAGLVRQESVGLGWFAALVLGSVAALPVHELVHALFFKAFSRGACEISFGFEQCMLYTRTNDLVLPRGAFIAVLLAPAVLVTAALFGVALWFGCPMLGWLLAVLHLSGCTGDLGMVREILAEPATTHVQDTAFGITLLDSAGDSGPR